MEKVLELGIKEGQVGGWYSWGVAVIRGAPITSFTVHFTLPLALTLRLSIERPVSYYDPICAGSKWWWLSMRFRWYRFLSLGFELPLWRGTD